jgi:hypothetical protein
MGSGMMEKAASIRKAAFFYVQFMSGKSERGSERMKRWVLLLTATMVLSGCGQLARESEFWDHSSMYQDWGHLCFSVGGYKNCEREDALKSKRDGWWGITMPCGAVAAAVPLVEGQKAKEPPKEEALAPEKKTEQKETPVEKKKEKKKKKKKTKSKRKKTSNP